MSGVVWLILKGIFVKVTEKIPSKLRAFQSNLQVSIGLAIILMLITFSSMSARAQTFITPTKATNFYNVGGAPSATYLNSKLYVAYRDVNTNELSVVTSTDGGQTFSGPVLDPSVVMPSGDDPVIAAFNNKLFIAYECGSCGNLIYMTTTTDGVNFTTPYVVGGGFDIRGYAPAMVAYDNRLFLAWISASIPGDSSGYSIEYSQSQDGQSWYSELPVGLNSDGFLVPPTLGVSNNVLYIAEQQYPNHNLVLGQWSGSQFYNFYTYPKTFIGSRAQLSDSYEGLVIAFKSNDSTNHLFVTSCPEISYYGTGSCTIPATYYNTQILDGPSIAYINGIPNSLILFYKSNDNYNRLLYLPGQ